MLKGCEFIKVCYVNEDKDQLSTEVNIFLNYKFTSVKSSQKHFSTSRVKCHWKINFKI